MKKDDAIKKSYDFAADLSKQMITLSMAILTLCVAFTDKLFTTFGNAYCLVASLCAFAVSIGCGIIHLMGLTGQLGNHKPKCSHDEEGAGNNPEKTISPNVDQEADLSIYSPDNRRTSFFQVLFFLLGLVLALGYIIASMISMQAKENNDTAVEDTCQCIKKSTPSAYKSNKQDTILLQINATFHQ